MEHGGSEEYVKFAKIVQQYLEENYGATVEQIISNNDKSLVLYNSDLKKIVELPITDDLSILDYYVNNYYNEEI